VLYFTNSPLYHQGEYLKIRSRSCVIAAQALPYISRGEMVSAVIADIRNLSYLLHPPFIDELGLGPVIREYAQGLQKRSGIRVQVEFPPEVGRLSQDQEIAIFRIIQEGTFIDIPGARWQILQCTVAKTVWSSKFVTKAGAYPLTVSTRTEESASTVCRSGCVRWVAVCK
jgi:hypothetical protein